MLMTYMVLMAWIDLGRMKMYAATRWLWLALSGGLFVAAPVGCDSENTPQVLYGPPPDAQVDADADVPQVLYGPVQDVTDPGTVPDAGTDTPQVLYGPPPDASMDTATDTPQVLYGPPPTDAVEDAPLSDVMQPLYGAYQDLTWTDAPPTDTPQVLYGPVPVDATKDSPQDASPDAEMPQVLYGPPGA